MTSLPTPATLRAKVLNLARAELVVKPAHYGASMRTGVPEVFTVGEREKVNASDIHRLYDVLRPSPSKLIAILNPDPEEEMLRPVQYLHYIWLKDFIYCATNEVLEQFLQFVTGVPVLPMGHESQDKFIHVMFTSDRGLSLAPKAHTCGNVLELPCNWANLQDFKRDLLCVVQSEEAYVMNLA